MIIVQKYGGATLETPEKIKNVATRIADLKKKSIDVVAVVSAMGSTTNQLIQLAGQVSEKPLLRELDMLLSTGERISMSLVSMALNDLGCDAISLTGSQAGILTDQSHINAMITDVKAFRVEESLKQNKVVILAGFQGVNPITKEITTLGRGGSDTTAVAMASYLKADRCEILKDVKSIFTADPKICTEAKPLSRLNYAILLEMTYWGAKVLHYRSVELAKMNSVKLYVGPALSDPNQVQEGTLIQEDFMFESTQPIAVNSHNLVLAIQSKNTTINFSHEFTDFLQKNNIGMPQILFSQVHNEDRLTYLAGPIEILQQIISLIKKENDLFKLYDESLCSVSLTCTGSSLNDVLIQCEKKLCDNKIESVAFIQSAMSLNFILKNSNRSEAIKSLHSLIKI